jgi:HK97 family phage major capsid protein
MDLSKIEELKKRVTEEATEAVATEEPPAEDTIEERNMETTENLTPTAVDPGQAEVRGAPNIRHGEDPLTSRGYSYARAISGLITGEWNQAKVEVEIHRALAQRFPTTRQNSILVPYTARAMGEGTDTAGGYLVQPEQLDEIIELLRTNLVVQAAGAREIELPRSGQLTIPKRTGKATAYWIGEGSTITASDLSYGQLALNAKKLAAFVVVSNELIADATPSVEADIRRDLALTLAEAEDLAYIQGTGADNQPTGIINTSGISTYTLANDAGNGASITVDDIYGIMEEFEEAKGNLSRAAWIMAPRTKYDLAVLKDSNGRFLWQNSLQEGLPDILAGIPVYISHQIPVNLTKGTNTDTSYIILGQFEYAYIGRHMALELSVSEEFLFQNDQTAIRAIERVDFGLAQPATFVYTDGVRPA